MSGVTKTNVQLGDSGTATQNFTLTVPAVPDGTMKLARGNAGATTQDIMTVDAAGKVKLPAGNDMLGVGQTWQDVAGSRVIGTTYTNSTGKPISVSVALTQSGANVNTTLAVSGVDVDVVTTVAGIYAKLYAIVPDGAVYKVNTGTGISLGFWKELR